jgi:hypothetical protein
MIFNVTEKMSSRKNPPGAKPINRQSMNPHHDSFSDNSSNDDSEMKKNPTSKSKKRKVREDASNSSLKRKKASKKDDIIILTSPKGSRHAAIAEPNDFSMSNIPRRKVPVVASAATMTQIPGRMPQLNPTDSIMVTPSKESALLPISIEEGNNQHVNSPGSKSSDNASIPDQPPIPQCIFTAGASKMVVVHDDNNSNANAMQIVSPRDSSTVASSVQDSVSRVLHNPYAKTYRGNNSNESRNATGNEVTTSRVGMSNLFTSGVAPPPQFPDKAVLRCAYINTTNEQTVIFLFEQRGGKAFWVQNLINKAINARKPWVVTTFPFAASESDSVGAAYWHIKNTKVTVGDTTYGIKLFHYTTENIQNTIELTKTAHALQNELMLAGSVIQIIIDDDNLFLYNRSCVWSNLISELNCYDRLHYELNIDYFSPSIWDNHRETLGKYFFPRNLSKNQAFKLYAPIEEIRANIPRIQALLEEIEARNTERNHQLNIIRNVGANMNPMDDIIENVHHISIQQDAVKENILQDTNN